MKKTKRTKLESAGWTVGTTAEFLGLSAEEAAFVELKLALAASLRKQRQSRGLTQTDLADKLGSSQSRVARMEAADAQVSIDLLLRALLALGVTRKELAKIIASGPGRSAA